MEIRAVRSSPARPPPPLYHNRASLSRGNTAQKTFLFLGKLQHFDQRAFLVKNCLNGKNWRNSGPAAVKARPNYTTSTGRLSIGNLHKDLLFFLLLLDKKKTFLKKEGFLLHEVLVYQ